MNSFFAGKKFLVTGASRGIGRALAKELSKSGGKVYALGRTKELLESLAQETSNIHPVVADLSDWELTRKIVDRLDCFDGVVNNAALTGDFGAVNALDCPREWLESACRTNMLAAINVIQSTAPKMIERGKGGSIVNISSVLGIYPLKNFIYYNISKAALDMVTKQFALELGHYQIRVNSVNPTVVSAGSVVEMPDYKEWSDISKQLTPLGRVCNEKEVVQPIMYLLSDQASMVTSSIHVVDGGLFTRAPWIS